jgi:FkbM family methyltransferase
VVILRRGTFDAAIWSSVEEDYPHLPTAFEPGDVVLDVGCHTGAVCRLAAERGATVVGYEASFENYGLAVINLRQMPSVTLHHAAVWRSDTPRPTRLQFTPSADPGNTGGGSTLFSSLQDHWGAVPAEQEGPGLPGPGLSGHEVPTVSLDEILERTGPVRLLKLDVEGSEFPILLTARRLHMVSTIVGEYHEFTEAAMALLAPEARVGAERYSVELLRSCLEQAGFAVARIVPGAPGRGFFTAHRSGGVR